MALINVWTAEAIEAEFKALADRIERVETAKAIGEIAGVGRIESCIEALETKVRQLDERTSFFPLSAKEDIPYDKHGKPQFQVGDTIELCGGGLRIVLDVNPDSGMKLLDVETKDQWWASQLDLYTLVYRPEYPKPKDSHV